MIKYKPMQSYEAIITFDPRIGEEKISQLLARIEKRIVDNGGEIEKTDKIGVRKLAFTYQRFKSLKDGYFTIMHFKGKANIPNIVYDNLKVIDGIIRYIVTRSEGLNPEAVAAPAGEEKVDVDPSMLAGEKSGES